MRRLTTFTLVAALLAGCTGSSGETTTTASAETTTTAAAAATTTAIMETTTIAETTTTAGSATGSDDCLVGTWVLDTDAFVSNFSSIFENAGMPDAEVTALDGTFTVEMGVDGSLAGTRDSWGFAIGSDQGNFTVEINGTESGTWSTDGDNLIVDIESSDLTVSSTLESGGQVVELPENQIPVETPPGIASNSRYTCSGDVLTLTNAGVETVLNRA